jgi:hypothetical protein
LNESRSDDRDASARDTVSRAPHLRARSSGPLGRIADTVEGFFGWFKTKKPVDKSITFDKDKDGRITGGKVESK